jgi:Xaa-Pro aminopeptidase
MNQYKNNRSRLLGLLKSNSMVLLSSGVAKHKTLDQYFPFQVNKSFFYLTGIREDDCTLLLIKGKKKVHEYLFIEETTEFMKQWVGAKISKEEASDVSGINQSSIIYNSKFDSLISSFMSEYDYYNVGEIHNLYLDLFRISKSDKPVSFTQFKNVIENYKELKITKLNKHISYLRMFKTEQEINTLKEAISITEKGLNRIMKELPNRENEYQIEADFNHELKLNGAEGLSFDTILASGSNGCILHYEDNNSPLHKGDLLLCDLGAGLQEYGADISRTYPVSGTYSPRQKQIYEIVLKCNKECIQFAKPGITLGELHKKSQEILSTECVKIGLIKKPTDISKYYYHNVTHFLGLDTHDVGISNTLLQPGMILTVEPGLYIKEESIGIRIEDDVLITESGSINLSKSIIKEIKDIEAYMKRNAK